MFLHGYQRGYMPTADRARVLVFDKRLSASVTDTHVTTGHDQSVFDLSKADHALAVSLIIFDSFMALFRIFFVCHSIYGLNLEWKSIDLKKDKNR